MKLKGKIGSLEEEERVYHYVRVSLLNLDAGLDVYAHFYTKDYTTKRKAREVAKRIAAKLGCEIEWEN